MRAFHVLSLVVAICLLSGAAGANVLVYEGFATPGDYTNGTNYAAQAAGGEGWAGPYTDTTGTGAGQTVSTSLNYAGLPSEDGSLSKPAGLRMNGARMFTPNPTMFATGGDVWFSAIFKRTAGSNNFGINVSQQTHEYYGVGFRSENFTGNITANIGGTPGTTSTKTAFANGDTVFVIGRVLVDAGSAGVGSHIVDLWVNPSLTADLSSAAPRSGDSWIDRTYVGFAIADRVNFYAHQSSAVTYDEIRIGSTFDDVVGVPEPATMTLLGLGAAALLRKRNR